MGGYRYLLIIVCRFSGWVEAYPTKKEDAESVVKILTTEIVPGNESRGRVRDSSPIRIGVPPPEPGISRKGKSVPQANYE